MMRNLPEKINPGIMAQGVMAILRMFRGMLGKPLCRDVQMVEPPRLVVFSTEIRVGTTALPVGAEPPEVSMDVVGGLSSQATVGHVPLRPAVEMATDVLRQDAPMVYEMPRLQMRVPVYSAGAFGKAALPLCRKVPMRTTVPAAFSGLTQAIPRPPVHSVALEPVSASGCIGVTAVPASLKAVAVLRGDRFFGLPIRKMPIPAHRFSPSVREAFCRALAEQAGTLPANILLKSVFAQMRMALYASVQADKGGLLCVPRRRDTLHEQGERGVDAESWLALGIRLDNREAVRAFVPGDRIAAATATATAVKESTGE